MSSLIRLLAIGIPIVTAFTTSNYHRSIQSRQQSNPTAAAAASVIPTRYSSTQLYVYIRPDQQLQFGSDNPDADQQDILEESKDAIDADEVYAAEVRLRQSVVGKRLEEQNEEFKEERRKQQWGEFANAKSKEDIFELEQKIRVRTDRENEAKFLNAKQMGVEMEVLEAPESSIFDDTSSNSKISIGMNALSFESRLDKDLEEEWEAMESGNEQIASGDEVDASAEDGSDGTSSAEGGNTVTDTFFRNGKLVSRNTMQGVRVGSAGGWSLEVFPGDFVVHRKYGIGKFERTCLRPKNKLTDEEEEARDKRRKELLKSEVAAIGGKPTRQQVQQINSKFGTEADTDPVSNPRVTVLEISYADCTVHVPVDRAYRLSRYRAGDSVVKPRLSRVRGGAWQRNRRKVEDNTLQLAQDVLALYATRETLQRQPFDATKEDEVKSFGQTFKFEPTPDQYKCFEDVENDMVWRSRPMDRLICGDVGFGKTEVALRALYRCAANGKQAAMLAPTGVLASQHFKNVVSRMGEGTEFNKRICLLRGGMGIKTKEGKKLRKAIEDGEVDIIVGTHALLGKDMKFNNLGLLVVDEEQRFGVKQKERLKLICGGIDVLTLSATPIPRTLQMSLSGIRDTSTIRSPPPMRKPTLSFVQEFNEEIVAHAISEELARGGQCYYVVPRISMLEEAQEMLAKCFPDLRIVQAHGRMHRNTAENNVALFAEGNYDVLLATTVIENGVDIPTVNTIIIQDSQKFGMSTLYQLRGRVGRSDLQGYAYLLHREESVTEQAVLRLQAIGELQELGAGFDVANRDLEIRGAGSLLGTEQSGMAAKVGFDLYMRMLKKSIRRLRGLDLPLVPRTNIILPRGEGRLVKEDDGSSAGSVHLFNIPESYIPDVVERQQEASSARLADSSSLLVDLTNKWKNQYGPVPKELQNSLKTLHLHACTRRLGIDLIGLQDNGAGRIDCILRSPGFRPRHWGIILPLLKKGVAPKGLDVVFPSRFTRSGMEEEIEGGKKYDLKSLLEDKSLDDDAEDWDALDDEEVEALKEISSAYNVTDLDEIDLEQYPRFIVKDFGTGPKSVDRLLQLLLPVANVVQTKQEAEKDEAKAASSLRERQSLLQQKKKDLEEQERKRYLID